MSKQSMRLARRIREELPELERVIARVQEGWQRAQQSADDLYVDAVALGIHGFYTGIERIFELIASTVDGIVPQEANWHQALLNQMAKEIPHVRPAVI